MSSSLPALRFEDYEAIADAVAETERGRWFLNEFARRNRVADTAVVLEAIAAIEARLASGERPRMGVAAENLLEDALALVASAAGIAYRLRGELDESPQDETTRALCRELEETLGKAVERMGRSGPDDAAISPPAEPNSAEDADLGQDFDWVQIADEAAAFDAAFEATGSEAIDEAKPDQDVNSVDGDLAAFSAPDKLDDGPADEPAALPTRQDEIAAPPVRRRRPAGWSPGLLDRLSPAERAILFG